MALATLENVRAIGNLPVAAKLPDAVLSPHLERGARELAKWVGSYSAATGDFRAACIDAECCLTMYYSLPVLNTFFTQGITTLQKEVGEMDFLFHNPDDLEKVRRMWWDRARDDVDDYLGQDSSGESKIGFYAV